jgi:hypothetical protein
MEREMTSLDADPQEGKPLTLIDENGNRLVCECTFAQRFSNREGEANKVVLWFEDAEKAMELFHFVWCKVLNREASWLK